MEEPGPSGWTSIEHDQGENGEEVYEPSALEMVPVEILIKIFSHFDLPTRGSASMVIPLIDITKE